MATFATIPPPVQTKRAVILGATGAIGRELVADLVHDPSVAAVVAVSRSPLTTDAEKRAKFPVGPDVPLAKLSVVAVDWEGYLSGGGPSDLFEGCDYLAACMGTTRKDAGGAAEFERIDHDYSVFAAGKAREAGVGTVHLVSSQGASQGSWLLYPRTKGRIEEAYKKLGFDTLNIYRPGLLNRGDKLRSGEAFLVRSAPHPILGSRPAPANPPPPPPAAQVNWLGVSAIPTHQVSGAMAHHLRTGTLKGQNGTLFFNKGIEQAARVAQARGAA
jgi:uncharacterized protein YbjT (DUF2867 family)